MPVAVCYHFVSLEFMSWQWIGGMKFVNSRQNGTSPVKLDVSNNYPTQDEDGMALSPCAHIVALITWPSVTRGNGVRTDIAIHRNHDK